MITLFKKETCKSDISVVCTLTAISYASCTLSPSAFGESLGKELPEKRLSECDSTLLPRALNPREARARRRRTDESVTVPANWNFGFLYQNFRFFFSKFCFFFQILMFFEILTFFSKITTFLNVFVAYFCQTSERIDDFGAWHEAIARWDMRPFDSCIADR